MLTREMKELVQKSAAAGWVLEPDAKKIMQAAGLDVPTSMVAKNIKEATAFLSSIQKPVAAKAVSAQILHKTEVQAVAINITDPDTLAEQVARLLQFPGCEAVLVEEMVHGVEVIVGAKNDFQFGPVVVFGLGGTAVELYNDTAIRMAPLTADHVPSMVDSLQGGALLKGYRSGSQINMSALTRLIVNFSELIMDFEPLMESIDLNPVICTPDRCVIADARIMLKTDLKQDNSVS